METPDSLESDTGISASERAKRMSSPGFGYVLTEHMVSARWTAARQWHEFQVIPYQPLTIDPAMISLHYGQIAFEGLKAYLLGDGSVGIFRPLAHASRFRRSARRLVMPEMSDDLFLRSAEELVRADRDWVPAELGHSLYLRPIMFGTDPVLALRPALEYRFLLVAFVAEGFFNNDLSPVTVWVSTNYSRAAAGGTGDVKVPGNYAGAFAAQVEASGNGCDQVVWLDAAERRWVEEMGGMNLFFVYGDSVPTRVTTPPLTGTLLPGITRDTLLTLIPEAGMRVDESPLSVDQWQRHCESGTITEVFACGTAAGTTPVGQVRSAAGSWQIADGAPGRVTRRLAELLSRARHGELPGRTDWLHVIR
jgi:branched-chain amino acid aminotransferase